MNPIAGAQARAGRGRRGAVDHTDERHERRARDADDSRDASIAAALLVDRREVALEHLAVARDAQIELLAGELRTAASISSRVADCAAVDLEDVVAGLDAGTRRGTTIEHIADHRRGQVECPANRDKVDDDGQEKIRGRPGEHDEQALPQRAAGEASAVGVGLALDAEDAERNRRAGTRRSGTRSRPTAREDGRSRWRPQDLDVEELRGDEVAGRG